METVLRKLIRGESVSDEDLEEALYEMCDNEHASCNEYCLIYSEVLNPERDKSVGCPYFKDGKKMLEALRKVFCVEGTVG